LTESGLSITEWNLVSGILPPLNAEDWEKEFAKYRATPEFKLLNHAIGLEEFQKIFFWEWAHRIMGRVIGLSFLLPLPIFIRYGLIRTKKTGWSLAGIGGLIGLQGGLGWYMVQSGLDQKELDQRDGVPRVSQYRLAAHLLMAFTVYSACIRLAGGLWRDWKVAVLDRPLFQQLNRHKIASTLESIQILNNKLPTRARFFIGSLTGLIFLTAGSGQCLISFN
jgi:cytochrome c oxidase assembly protein subunit 15